MLCISVYVFRPVEDFTIKEVKRVVIPISRKRFGNGSGNHQGNDGRLNGNQLDEDEDEMESLENRLLMYVTIFLS